MANAQIDWTSNDASVVRTFQKVEKGFDDISRRMERMENQSRRQTATMVGGFEKITGSITRTAQALIGGGSLLTAIDFVRDANRKLIEEAEQTGKKFDEIFRGFRVQAGLNALEGAQAQAQILLQAQRNAVLPEVAAAGASGLVSAGFSVQDATGGALNSLLSAQAAYVAAGKPVDTQNLAKQAASYFASQGMPSTTANFDALMKNAFALRQGSFELSQFADLASEGPNFKGYLTQQEQLAAFGTLVDVNSMSPSVAATTMRNVVQRLSTAGTTRTGLQALKQIGLTPEDVDFEGENIGTILDRLAGGLESIPKNERDDVLKLLFEQASVAGATTLIDERRGKFAKYLGGMATSGAAFDQAVRDAQKGPGAAERRQEVIRQTVQAAAASGDDLILNELAIAQQAAGVGVVGIGLDNAAFRGIRSAGVSQERALGFVLGMNARGTNLTPRELLRRVEARAQGELPPGFTTIESLEARDRARAEAAAVEAARQANTQLGLTQQERTRGFRKVGGNFRDRARNFLGLDDDPLVEALERNTQATKENTRQAGSGTLTQEVPASAARGGGGGIR